MSSLYSNIGSFGEKKNVKRDREKYSLPSLLLPTRQFPDQYQDKIQQLLHSQPTISTVSILFLTRIHIQTSSGAVKNEEIMGTFLFGFYFRTKQEALSGD